jgi:hypothetical protein
MNVKHYRPTNQTHNSFLINGQILFAAQFLDFHKHKKVFVALSLVEMALLRRHGATAY